ncbi:uncharacterized protein B0H64DRAFT_44606 [Chaetomium fimeti]|uniref:Uncharacterized protein n=1 Tax=Chaetomium fimeti TaxID=1854472 RepID=A0AAE0LMU0_9PEZI|nr:hypothetical protein B0H64DRAFT_44606 [Chaetomium fimeti]
MPGGPEFQFNPASTPATAPIAPPKRPVEETQHVGPSSLSQAQQDNNAFDSAASSEPRPRPVFKMRRTGHSGAFPLSGRPAATVRPGDNHATPSPSVPSFPSPATHASHDSHPSSGLVPGVLNQTERKPFQKTSSPVGPSHPTSQSQPTPAFNQDENRSTQESSRSYPNLPIAGFIKSMSGAQIPVFSLETTRSPKPSMPPEVQKVFDSALDDRSYKIWIGKPVID